MPSPFTALLGTPACSTDWTAVAADHGRDRIVIVNRAAATWPFVRITTPTIAPSQPALIVLEHLELAFPDAQSAGTRLVLTQATYQLQRWLDWLALHPSVSVVADLSSAAPPLVQEARSRRGPWSRVELLEVAVCDRATPSSSSLLDAFRQSSPVERYEACLHALATAAAIEPALLLALASACIEVGRLDEAFAALERAMRAAPDWEAVHFEMGKAWLRADDTARAAIAFAEAARLMPSLAVAHANLGAALGELERPGDALAALDTAVALDPAGYPAHNSRGACLRDLGRLADAEASFQRVIELRPDFPFGHYNLGQTFFLEGRFAEARRAYEAGLGRDQARTPWQRARLALACAALDDVVAAENHAAGALGDVQPERRPELVAEMHEVLEALAVVQGTANTAVRAVAALLTEAPDIS